MPLRVCVLRKRAGSHLSLAAQWPTLCGAICVDTSASTVTSHPPAFGLRKPTGRFESSAPLPLIPSPALAPVCFAPLGVLPLPPIPPAFPFLIPELLFPGFPPGLSRCHSEGHMVLIHFFRAEWCCELLLVLLSLLSFQDVLPAPDNLPHTRAFSCPLSYRGPQRETGSDEKS